MKTRILLLLASLLVVCICYYALIHNNRFWVPEGFLKIRPSDVSSITIFFSEKTYDFSRENDGWKLVGPKEHRVDQQYFSIFLKELTMLPKTQTISKNPEDLGLFGLEEPEIRIRITYGSDKKIIYLLLGSDNEAKTSTYAKVEGNTEIVLLGKTLKEDIKHIIDLVHAENIHS